MMVGETIVVTYIDGWALHGPTAHAGVVRSVAQVPTPEARAAVFQTRDATLAAIVRDDRPCRLRHVERPHGAQYRVTLTFDEIAHAVLEMLPDAYVAGDSVAHAIAVAEAITARYELQPPGPRA